MFEVVRQQMREMRATLAACPRDLSDAERIDLIREIEELHCVGRAAQATAAVDLDESQRAAQVEAGMRPERVGEGIAEQIALARRESAHKGSRLLGLAKVLDREMPHTLALMRQGLLNEWRATILARETACLSLEDRAEVDRRLCASVEAASMSDNALTRAAKKLAAELDAEAVTARARRAESERHVSIRPAPDTMCWVTALLPVKQAVSVYATLLAAANAARAQGEERSRGQVMADALVERATGTPADETPKVEVKVVMTDRSLFGTSDEAAHLAGYGPVPAPWARAFVKDATEKARAFIRRLYVEPRAGELIAMDSRARLAPKGLADFVATRDQDLCRTPWCGAPIAQTDHVEAFETGGETSALNSQGLCQRCNLAKQAPGWSARPVPGMGRHTIETITPTGHRHRSRAPSPPGGFADFSPPAERVAYEDTA